MKILENLKTYYKILVWSSKLKETIMENKNTEKKSELYLTIGTIVINLFLAIQGLIPAELLVKILAILSGVYTIARTLVKMTKTTKDDELLAKIEDILKKNNVDISNDK